MISQNLKKKQKKMIFLNLSKKKKKKQKLCYQNLEDLQKNYYNLIKLQGFLNLKDLLKSINQIQIYLKMFSSYLM